MVTPRRFTLTQYLIEQRRRFPGASGDLNALLLDVSIACKAIARQVAFGELRAGAETVGGAVNVQGEVQKHLDVVSNELFIRQAEWDGHLAGLARVHGQHGVGGLHEEERWLAAGEAHFLGMLGIVAAHAVDAVHGKALG